MNTLENLRDIIGKHPLIGYGALVLLVLRAALFVQPAYWGLQPPYLNALVTMITALLAIIPLAWRRFSLLTALIFVLVTVVVPDIHNFIIRVNLSSIASLIAVFSKAAYGGRRRNLICFASIVAFNGGLVYKLIISANAEFLSSATLVNVTSLFWNLLTFSAIWWLGNTMRLSRERTSLPRVITKLVVRGSKKNARWAVYYKLCDIIRGLHGLLAYNIRVISIQAGATCQVLKQYPEKVLNSLNHIKQSIRYVVVEGCHKFGLLWDEKQCDSSAAQSGIEQLEKPGTDVQTSGLQVAVEVAGEKREVFQTG